jgi:hypothetical protein
MAVNEGQVRFVASQVVAGVLEAASTPGHQQTLERAVRQWFPDPDRVDAIELRRVTTQVREFFLWTRASVMNRADRWVEEGKAERV